MLKNSYYFGKFAEKIAAAFLTLKGYKILAKRYKNHFGEIDLIAKKFSTVVFIEVKARRGKYLVEEVLRPKQLQRIKRSAEYFIAQNQQFHDKNIRFDFIEIGRNFWPKHQKNFWE